ncbi:MAG: hypothetical protein J6K73_07690 [Clostridia bacterium]|nr:hypothetical protein [Clostridia bacterium]MBP3649647.1 hypothetical protein [Clostridia bacterium]
MAGRTRRSRQREEEALQLEEVLEPYDDQQAYAFQYDEGIAYEEPLNQDLYQQAEALHYPEAGYADYLPQEEYDEEEPELRFGVAVHVFDMISSLVGVFVILVLVAMLLTLVDWLRTDILHSFVMLQSGIS